MRDAWRPCVAYSRPGWTCRRAEGHSIHLGPCVLAASWWKRAQLLLLGRPL
ncbi:hypothetical protein [Rathayibacter sp. Leaf248]|uniref:hypothetical protein n=1 Tax=Rathayibacter sp. Leaf248 TaxID=2876555 RepID=UPI001E58AB57|nr:hypothetical protein [Rathayibacter sp. Leaf248]